METFFSRLNIGDRFIFSDNQDVYKTNSRNTAILEILNLSKDTEFTIIKDCKSNGKEITSKEIVFDGAQFPIRIKFAGVAYLKFIPIDYKVLIK